ncbi:MAG: archease [Desulfurococcales archaeon]|nr:archease [Desulfurococcales archaeon]
MECPGFRHEEHTADVLIEATGRTLEEAFEQSALGVYEVITDTSRVEPRKKIYLEVEGFDLENLLYRWIEEMLLYTDSEGLVFSIFRVCSIERNNDKWIIKSSIWGERFDQNRHEHRTIVKAMTYAQMSIVEEKGCWRITFVVDI